MHFVVVVTRLLGEVREPTGVTGVDATVAVVGIPLVGGTGVAVAESAPHTLTRRSAHARSVDRVTGTDVRRVRSPTSSTLVCASRPGWGAPYGVEMMGDGTATAERVAKASIDRGVFERLTDDDLASLVDDPLPGWGATERVAVDGTRAFIKRVPVTTVELESGGSTANLYGIPTYLNYPYGSPGLGVARELQFALKATQWVEDGTCTAFPILLHHRVVEHRDRLGDPGSGGRLHRLSR